MYRLHLVIPIIILLGLLTGVIITSLVAVKNPLNNRSAPSMTDMSPTAIEVTLTLPAAAIQYNQAMTATVEVDNRGSQPYRYTFATLCTEPTFLLDGQLLSINRLCAQQQTTVTLAPGDHRIYQLPFEPVDPHALSTPDGLGAYAIPTGEHQLQAAWGDKASEGVTINVTHD